jgi:hypothetical protein
LVDIWITWSLGLNTFILIGRQGDTCSEHHQFSVDGSKSFEVPPVPAPLVAGWLALQLRMVMIILILRPDIA